MKTLPALLRGWRAVRLGNQGGSSLCGCAQLRGQLQWGSLTGTTLFSGAKMMPVRRSMAGDSMKAVAAPWNPVFGGGGGGEGGGEGGGGAGIGASCKATQRHR